MGRSPKTAATVRKLGTAGGPQPEPKGTTPLTTPAPGAGQPASKRRVHPLVVELTRRRRHLRVPMQRLARAMGYATANQIWQYETGRRMPGIDFAGRWADALGCLLVLVPLDEDGEQDHDPTPPGELLTKAQRSERLALMAKTNVPAKVIARQLAVSERTVNRRRQAKGTPK